LIKIQIDKIRVLYELDRRNNISGVFVPNALDFKYKNIGKEWAWFWLFPSKNLSVDPVTHITRRYHIYPTTIQREFKKALRKTGMIKRATLHSLRHGFATHLLESGYDIRTIQNLLGHKKLETTMIYTHVAKKNILGVKSPIDENFTQNN